ncbi:MAG: hypothetical protein Ct9H300mP16_06410 [Pseudomonadota bacterium]|nr:MAG: hypothetical protein Ct9H300mP16_06410 [Pseudomonadota bacterium]
MLTKILFTLAVIIAVALIFRVKSQTTRPAEPPGRRSGGRRRFRPVRRLHSARTGHRDLGAGVRAALERAAPET